MYSSIKRLYVEEELKKNKEIELFDQQHHYIKNVIRLKKGDSVFFFNGKEGEWLAKVIQINKKITKLLLEKKISEQKNTYDLWIVFSLIKNLRLNILIQKSTELGVSRFIPVTSERSNIKNYNIINLRKNAIEAAEQCGRLDIPAIDDLDKISNVIKTISKNRAIIFCDTHTNTSKNIVKIIREIKDKFSKWTLIIGPEGGFSDKERIKLLKLKNIYQVSLGKRVLRSDTAAIAAIFGLQQIIDN